MEEMNNNKQAEIHSKGFDIVNYRTMVPNEYGKIKVGTKTVEDAVLTLGQLRRVDPRIANKGIVLKALYERDLPLLREISNYFYTISGVYQRACDYYANLYRYDWYVVPEIFEDEKMNEKKIIQDFVKHLNYLDNSHIRKLCGEISLKVILNGAYYGYIIEGGDGILLQELPINYCRTRYSIKGIPAIEFNMKYFDDKFPDTQYRTRVLKLFPEDFQKGYRLYKQGKLIPDTIFDRDFGWYLLEPGMAVKFNLNNMDMPIFGSAIPAILDLDAAQDLDRRKQMQKLLKILIQKLPLDKNGDLIFDVDEAQDIHNNAVQMLQRAVGVDVVTTFADVDSIDLSDKNTTATQDDLQKVERTVYNAMGLSKNLFNTDGNLSLEKSILEDESTVRNLLLQYDTFINRIIMKRSGSQKKYKFRFFMLETTQYNYKEMSKLYKEQVQIGYSKMLPQIALGHSQSFIINTAYFENQVLHLSEIMIPPLMSSTLNGEDILGKRNQSDTSKNQNSTEDTKTSQKTISTEKKSSGRPEKPDDEKSEKTIQNRESMS